MQGILMATAVAIGVALFGTAVFINLLTRLGVGQQVRVDGPTTHLVKQGTPTMGGVVILLASSAGYLLSHIRVEAGGVVFRDPSKAGLLVVASMWALGLLGAADDLAKVTWRRSLGLTEKQKIVVQVFAGFALAFGAIRLVGIPPNISWTGVRDLPLVPQLPQVLFAVWVVAIIFVMSNGVNFTDGTDGLASGSSAMALFVYVVIAFWEFRHPAVYQQLPVEGLLDVSIAAAALLGACIGFLWWNCFPAKIQMGDTGAMALGGALAAMALFTKTQLLLLIIGGLFIAEFASSSIQRYVYKLTKRFWPSEQGGGRRVFAMAPLHHHFEMRGWEEVTVTVRFWLVAGVLAGVGLAMFYADFLASGGLD